jgi:hypothetical protein
MRGRESAGSYSNAGRVDEPLLLPPMLPGSLPTEPWPSAATVCRCQVRSARSRHRAVAGAALIRAVGGARAAGVSAVASPARTAAECCPRQCQVRSRPVSSPPEPGPVLPPVDPRAPHAAGAGSATAVAGAVRQRSRAPRGLVTQTPPSSPPAPPALRPCRRCARRAIPAYGDAIGWDRCSRREPCG